MTAAATGLTTVNFSLTNTAAIGDVDDGECGDDAAVGGGEYCFRECAGGDGAGFGQQSGGGSECDVHGFRCEVFGEAIRVAA